MWNCHHEQDMGIGDLRGRIHEIITETNQEQQIPQKSRKAQPHTIIFRGLHFTTPHKHDYTRHGDYLLNYASQRYTLHDVRLHKKLWKCSQTRLEEITHWVAYYFTNSNSWYPVSEHAMILLAILIIQPLPPVPMAPQSVQKRRDAMQTFVEVVHQHSVRQETKMTRSGTLLLYLAQREIQSR